MKEVEPEERVAAIQLQLVQEIIKNFSTGDFDRERYENELDQRTVSSPINHAAIELLRSWREGDEYDEEEMRTTWEYLKQTLDEDRPSDRKLFP